MGARKPDPRASRLVRFVRGRRFDRNPLRRDTDRMETVVLAVLVLVLLVGTPFAALASGTWVHGMARQAQLSQQASRYQVQADVLTVAAPADDKSLAFQVQARWRAPDGREVTAEVAAPSGTTAGEQLQVWTDKAGAITSAPLLDSQVAEQTLLGQVLGGFTAAGVLVLAGLVALSALNKRRMAAWDADWHATGPRWTTRA